MIPSELYNFNKNVAKPVHDTNCPSSQLVNFEEDEEFICEVVEESNVEERKLSTDNQNVIIQNQSLLLENQMRIIEQLANQETMIQLICQHLSSTKITASISQASDKATTSNEATPADPLPIDSLDKLEQFERDLSDETYMNELVS